MLKKIVLVCLSLLFVIGYCSTLGELSPTVHANADAIVYRAEQKLGRPYEWGGGRGSNPTSFDCSGLVYYSYKSFCSPIALNSDCAADQAQALINSGYDAGQVTKAVMLFYAQKNSSGNWIQPNRFMHINHVSMVYSNTKIIHALPSGGVQKSDIGWSSNSRVYQGSWKQYM